ncbi:MAG: Asp-tRNA(Asn)/Glu-tRNA(Gln) amidotransferase subunit GatC [Thermovirgaceae bacterium]
MVTEDEVRHIARLIRLEVAGEEVARLQQHFNEILEHFHSLGKVDLTGIDPFNPEEGRACPLREDEVLQWNGRDAAIGAAPLSEGDFFKVPQIMGEVENNDA